MKKFFVFAVIALLFTNCTTETQNIPASDLYVGNYTVNETRTYTEPSTGQEVTSLEQFLITINKIDDTTVRIIGFANCTAKESRANASESTLVITNVPSYICGVINSNNPPSSIIINKTNDGFSFTYNNDYYRIDSNGQGTPVTVSVTGTAVKS